MLLLLLLLPLSLATEAVTPPTTSQPEESRPVSSLALRFTDPGPGCWSSTGVDAFQLTVTSSVTVSALCYFDHGGGWGGRRYPVTLYRSADRQPLAAARVSEEDEAHGRFRCAPVAPVRLVAGERYQLAGFTRSTATPMHISEPAGLSTAPGLRYDGYLYIVGADTVSYVTHTPDPGDVFFGPNMLLVR